jgi:transmembrane sensor
MADLEERLARARAHVAPAWTPERERTVRARVEARLELGQRRRVVALSFATLALVVGGLFAWDRLSPKGLASIAPHAMPRAAALQNALVPELLHFEDGSSVTAMTGDARAEPVEVGPSAVTVRLGSGAARFSVTPNAARTFRVLARDATVTVLGTVFTVALEPDGVRVAVERGRVHVEWPAGERILGVGEQVLAGEERIHPEGPASAPTPDASPSDRVAPHASGVPATAPSWRSLAQDGDYGRAFARMSAEGAAAIRDEPGDLLLSADVARLGGHPEKAIAPLERVLSAHAGDSRAPLAAFTLGRTLLDQLGRPNEAARAFASARRLDSRGALAQDALAREVESWSRAGDAPAARERALEYTTLYPKGRRLKAVRRLGGLD